MAMRWAALAASALRQTRVPLRWPAVASRQQNGHAARGAALIGAVAATTWAAFTSAAQCEATAITHEPMSEAMWVRRLAELRSTRQLFEEFCTLEENGIKYMQPRDVLHALALCPPFQERTLDKKALEEIKMLFAIADTDFDGLISFEEFIFFLKLLNTSPDQFLIVFKMFDLDGSGKLDYSEFQQVIRAQGGQQPVDATPGKIAIPGGILSQWFGPDGSKSFSLEQFVRFLEDLQASILRAQYDAQRAGTITGRQFALLVASHSHAVAEFAPAIAALPAALAEAPVTLKQYVAFERMLSEIDDIVVALRFTPATSSGVVKKKEFQRIAAVVSDAELSDTQMDVLWRLLDRDSDKGVTLADIRWWALSRNQIDTQAAAEKSLFLHVHRFIECVRSPVNR